VSGLYLEPSNLTFLCIAFEMLNCVTRIMGTDRDWKPMVISEASNRLIPLDQHHGSGTFESAKTPSDIRTGNKPQAPRV
jgi:hypothetical protein